MKEKTSLALTHELFHLMQQIPRLRPRQNSTDGLTPSEQALLVMLLLNLDVTKKAATVTEIGNLLQITPAGVTHLLNPLEEIGYIERLTRPEEVDEDQRGEPARDAVPLDKNSFTLRASEVSDS